MPWPLRNIFPRIAHGFNRRVVVSNASAAPNALVNAFVQFIDCKLCSDASSKSVRLHTGLNGATCKDLLFGSHLRSGRTHAHLDIIAPIVHDASRNSTL